MSEERAKEFLTSNKDSILLGLKVIFFILFLISLAGLYHYESNIKGHYQSNPESYEKDSETIVSYLDDKGCSSVQEVSEELDFGRLQARYLMHKMSKENTVVKYEARGICLSFRAKAILGLRKSQ